MTGSQGKSAPKVDDASTTTAVGTAVADSIDMRKGLLWQIHTLTRAQGAGRLTREEYSRWVHTPYYYKEDPRHMRFFENEFLETFSKVCVVVLTGCSGAVRGAALLSTCVRRPLGCFPAEGVL